MCVKSVLRMIGLVAVLALGLAATPGLAQDAPGVTSGPALAHEADLQVALTERARSEQALEPTSPLGYIELDRGCGARFAVGEFIHGYAGVRTDSYVELYGATNGSERLLWSGYLRADEALHLRGTAALPNGRRVLRMKISSSYGSDEAQCDFTVGSGAPPPRPSDLTAEMTLDRGCGGSYQQGQAILLRYRASRDTYAYGTSKKSDGSTYVFVNGWIRGGQWYEIRGTAGSPGPRHLKLDVQASDGQRATANCAFSVGQGGSRPPITCQQGACGWLELCRGFPQLGRLYFPVGGPLSTAGKLHFDLNGDGRENDGPDTVWTGRPNSGWFNYQADCERLVAFWFVDSDGDGTFDKKVTAWYDQSGYRLRVEQWP
jgi:hypothetical protein